MIVDQLGRSFKKLRVSLTHDCNYSCIYCSYGNKPDNKPQPSENAMVPEKKVLSGKEIIEIIRILHAELTLKTIRLTGGEPLLHPGILNIICAVREMGIADIGMTTNGHILSNRVKALYEAGLQSVNISLDALSEDMFTKMSRHSGFYKVLNAIDAAINQGLRVKLNAVVVAGKNESEIIPLLDFAIQKGILIRFLELMPMGPLYNKRNGLFFSSAQIIEVIQRRYSVSSSPREEGATADYWYINGRKAFGIIANDSSPFCVDCSRLRLDSYGNIYGCLSSLIPVPVTANIRTEELHSALKLAITHKQSSHFTGNSRTMQSIGG